MTLLYIEDDALVARATLRWLQSRWSGDVLHRTTVSGALAALPHARAVVTDWHLIGEDSADIVRAAADAGVPCVIYSGGYDGPHIAKGDLAELRAWLEAHR